MDKEWTKNGQRMYKECAKKEYTIISHYCIYNYGTILFSKYKI